MLTTNKYLQTLAEHAKKENPEAGIISHSPDQNGMRITGL